MHSDKTATAGGNARQRYPKDGAALIIVLVIIVLVTLVTICFVVKSGIDVKSSGNFSAGVSADLLADDGINQVIGALQSEIHSTAKSKTVPGPVYIPLAAAGIPPTLDAEAAALALEGVPNLLMSSATGALASRIPTSDPSLNGRILRAARWNAPLLLTGSNLVMTGTSVPNWIYIDRTGPVKLTAWSPGIATPQLSGSMNPSFVLGRVAYRVYDISGLLDMNAAGYPSGEITSGSGSQLGRKGALAMADLYDAPIPGFAPATGGLLTWRGPATAVYTSGSAAYLSGTSAYDIYLNEFARPYGFMIAPPAQPYANPDSGNTISVGQANRFMDRSDLITYCNSDPAEFTDISDNQALFLSQATSFSRELNAPSWGGTDAWNSPGGTPLQSSPAAMNPDLPTILVSGTFTRRDGSIAKAGEALVKTRFPLEKINLLRNPAANATAIRQYFGLQWDTSVDEWKYVNGTVTNDPNLPEDTEDNPGNKFRERMHTLAEVAVSGTREPDFFELLQAGIQADSLGIGASDNNQSQNEDRGMPIFPTAWKDQNIARHVLQIGANIIDQYRTYDPTNGPDPTVIERTPLSALTPATPDPDIAGVNNLPYIQLIGRTPFRRFDVTTTGTDGNGDVVTNYPDVTEYYQFQLWNPHQNAAAMPSGETFRIVAQGQIQLMVKGVAGKAGSEILGPAVTYNPSSDYIQFTLASDSKGGKFSEPSMLFANSPGLSTSGSASSYTYGASSIVGFCQGIVNAPYNGFAPTTTGSSAYERYGLWNDTNGSMPAGLQYTPEASGTFVGHISTEILSADGITFQLQKEDIHGKWLPVQTIASGTGGFLQNEESVMVNMLYLTSNTRPQSTIKPEPAYASDSYWINSGTSCWLDDTSIFPDPRTTRFGLFNVASTSENGVTTPGSAIVNCPATAPGPEMYFEGWLPSNTGSSGNVRTAVIDCYGLLFYLNKSIYTGSGSVNYAYYTDRGKAVTRVGDTAVNGGSPYTASTSTSPNLNRPIILNRPFFSVAELGYAGRDLPWKSLNLSRDNDAATASAPTIPADAPLLDIFSLTETPVRAGVINLNTASHAALTALLEGTNVTPTDLASDSSTALSSMEAGAVATDILAYTGSNRAAPSNILVTAADISKAIQASPTAAAWTKDKKEAVLAALADVHNARTWNVLIDLYAQVGRFPVNGSASLDQFQVNGQKHIMVEVAIDRYTGQIVDEVFEKPSDEILLQ